MCLCVCCSVVHSYVAEQVGHGLPVVDAADGLRQDHADVHRFDFGTLELLELVWNRVGHHHLEKRRTHETRRREDVKARRREDEKTRRQEDERTRRREDEKTRGREDERMRRQEDKKTRG